VGPRRKNELYQATRDREAWQWLELSNPLRYGLAMLSPAATTGARCAPAHEGRADGRDYQQLFGGLARSSASPWWPARSCCPPLT
jgi:hypothetical protein